MATTKSAKLTPAQTLTAEQAKIDARLGRAAPRRFPAPTTPFEVWKHEAQTVATELFDGNLGDIWGPGDDYDLVDEAAAAFARGTTAAAFIEKAFEEDLARMDGDEAEYEDSLREGDEGEDECFNEPDEA